MVDRRRIQNVVHYDYTPATIDYDVDFDAFAIARADVYSPEHPHHLALVVVVTERDLSADRLSLQEAIVRGRRILERLLTEHRGIADRLSANTVWVFSVGGQRIR
jgi:hypothetical protein